MAASHPWSAPGELKAMVIRSPSRTEPSPLASFEPALSPDASSSSPDSHPASTRTATAIPPRIWCCRLRIVVSPSISGRLVVVASAVAALQGGGAEDDHALGELLELGRHVEQVEQVEDQAEGDDAEEGAGDRGPPSRQAGPPDDDRGDGVELEQVSGDRRRAPQAPAQQNRGDADTQPRQDIDAGHDQRGPD